MRNGLLVAGIISILMEFLWIGQGTGYFPYPGSSFMINQMSWAYMGTAMAAVGLVSVVASIWRLGRS
jgi:hypothetical protein